MVGVQPRVLDGHVTSTDKNKTIMVEVKTRRGHPYYDRWSRSKTRRTSAVWVTSSVLRSRDYPAGKCAGGCVSTSPGIASGTVAAATRHRLGCGRSALAIQNGRLVRQEGRGSAARLEAVVRHRLGRGRSILAAQHGRLVRQESRGSAARLTAGPAAGEGHPPRLKIRAHPEQNSPREASFPLWRSLYLCSRSYYTTRTQPLMLRRNDRARPYRPSASRAQRHLPRRHLLALRLNQNL